MAWKEEKLYRIEIVEDISYFDEKKASYWFLYEHFRNPLEFTKENGIPRIKKMEGIIQKGIKGYVIRQWGKKFFSPDVEQEGIERFTPVDNPYILVPFQKIQGHYRILSPEGDTLEF